ncbi:hypothetical protein LCGC14_0721400 [marine sediment metagenome]|uniref:Uncharacterized protein n=1 Tax=marine sediment metagenome TaxID=412755 RepID=A0A0F9QCB7_9ZZZZ|nr:hypothetical protein [archaeon]
MTEEEIDKTVKKVMKEIRESDDYQGNSCCAQSNSECQQNNLIREANTSSSLLDSPFCEADAKD